MSRSGARGPVPPPGTVRRIDGCLVCPWHQSRYDVRDGRMVTGPRGFLGYRGPPGYSRLVRTYSRVMRLRVRRARVRDGEVGLD